MWCFGGIIILSVIAILGLTHNFFLIAAFIVSSYILFRAVIFSLDKQVVTLIANQIQDFQADFWILGCLVSGSATKLSGYLYIHYGLSSIIYCFVILSGLVGLVALKIPAVKELEIQDIHKAQNTPAMIEVIRILIRKKQMLLFVGLVMAIMLLESSNSILITAKIHFENLGVSTFATIGLVEGIFSVVGALSCKLKFVRKLKISNLLGIPVFMLGVSCLVLVFTHSPFLLVMVLAIKVIFTYFLAVNIEVQLSKFIINDVELIKISPLVNGIAVSARYLMFIIGPIIFGIFLNYNINYNILFMLVGAILFILSVLIFKLKRYLY
jgi:hypothetical protein